MCALIGCWALSFVFAIAFTCGTNISYAWSNHKLVAEHCDNATAWGVAFAVSDLLTDLMVLALPLPMVWQLQKTKLQRLEICGVFLLGLL